MNIINIIWASLIASVAWFLVGGLLYMNPLTAKIYKSYENAPGFKKWKSTKKYLLNMFVFGNLLQIILFAFVYSFIEPVLNDTLLMNALNFAIILIFVKIIPRLIDMFMQSTYPNKLLLIEVINGSIGSIITALIFVWII